MVVLQKKVVMSFIFSLAVLQLSACSDFSNQTKPEVKEQSRTINVKELTKQPHDSLSR